MDNQHYYMPAGLPPGEGPRSQRDDTPPEGVYYYRIYAGIFCVACIASIVTGIAALVGELHPSASSSGAPQRDLMEGFGFSVVGVVFLVPILLSLLAGRRPWVHTLCSVLIAMTVLPLCCLPVAVPMLVVWQKPETKRWFGI